MKKATYKVVRFTKVNRFVAVAWNYDEAVLIATRDHASRKDAFTELQGLCAERNVKIQWFDGDYRCDGHGDFLTPEENNEG